MKIFFEFFSLGICSSENFSSENFSSENFGSEILASENFCLGKFLLPCRPSTSLPSSLPPRFRLPSSSLPPPPCSSLELPLSSDLAPRDPPPGPRHLVGTNNRPMENASKKAKGVSGSGSSPKKLLPGPYSSKHVQLFRNFDGLQDGRQGDVVISLHTFEGLVLGCIDADFCK